MKNILVVGAGCVPKKKDLEEASELCINLGALGIATTLKKLGYNVMMIQGDSENPETTICKILNFQPDKILISALSILCVPWIAEFTEKYHPAKIALGGKYLVDHNVPWLKAKLPYITQFYLGSVDGKEEDLILNENPICMGTSPKGCYENLDYTILKDFKRYQPSIEASRGCGANCKFCPEHEYSILPIRSPESIIDECLSLCRLYADEHLNIYFESACLILTKPWAKKFCELYRKNNAKFKWRCTTRVDTYQLGLKETKELAKCGFAVVDLGLESASEEILKKMNKTSNPKKYLASCDKTIAKLSEAGIWVKLNLIIYDGETQKETRETLNWLEIRRKHIKGLSVNELSYYRYGEPSCLPTEIMDEINEHGYYTIHNEECYNMLASYTSPTDKEELKAICYTPRNASRLS